jgi:hypothetical protein
MGKTNLDLVDMGVVFAVVLLALYAMAAIRRNRS